jgi:UDP-N-acetylmuramoyl-tripeptide--D-alanyl-D-alanine ligase
LGNNASEEHETIVEQLITLEFNDVFLLGEEFFKLKEKNQFKFFRQTSQMKDFLIENKIEGKTILIKGSRGMKLESLINLL